MKHKTLLLLAGLLFSWSSYAQEEKHFTQFSFNKLVFNPGYAGHSGNMAFTAMYRNQWTSIEGAPVTFNFNVHTPISEGRSGLGISIVSDQVGLFQKLHVDGAYNYKIPVFGNSIFSMGVSAESPIYLEQEGGLLGKRPYYFMSGFVLPLSRNVKLKPAALVSFIPSAPFEMDFSLSALFMERLWIGGAYRLGDSFGGMIQYDANDQLQIGVSFDFTVSDLKKFTGQTMEFMMRYNMEFQNSDVRNIRYF